MATESFFSNASLAYLASAGAGKDGKTYSIKPTDGTGDFTFSRGSNLTATRVGPTGLIEKGRENLLLQSNQFDTTWVSSGTTETGGQADKDGGSTAWLLNRLGAFARLEQSISTSGVNTFSIYAKANTLNFLMLNDGVNACWFDLQNGIIGTDSGYVDSKIEPVGSGWYRCSVVSNSSISIVRVYPAVLDNNITNTTTGSIYIQDAQLEAGLAATDYIESGASTGKAGLLENEPRFDYSGGATCPSLLLEPQRVNLVKYSEYFEGTGWTTSANAEKVSSNNLSPSGELNAYKFKSINITGSTFVRFAVAVADNTDYTFSCYARSDNPSALTTGKLLQLQMSGGGQITSISSTLVTSEWKRFDITATSGTTSTAYCYLGVDWDVDAEIEFWGAQMEQGSYPTSYIPNHSGGSATRTGDLGDWVNNQIDTPILFGLNDDFTLFYEGQSIGDEIDRTRFMLVGGGFTGSGNDHKNRFWISDINKLNLDGDGGVVMGSATLSSNLPEQTNFKVLARKNGSTIDFFLNGVKQTTTQGTNSAFAVRTLFGSFNDFYTAYGRHKQILIFPTALSDADCITLTT